MNTYYMQKALELAQKAEGRTSPNPMVGAVIVRENQIVGSGYHRKAGTPHAEVHAIREAGSLAQGADLYVTMEPCNHTGKTPPCSVAIIKAGIKRVFVAVRDPNPLVNGQGIATLRAHGIEVVEGIMENEARKLNEVFFKYIVHRTPFVALKTALSLDGKIATESGESQWITEEAARHHGHTLRNRYDAILAGIGTVQKDNPRLTCRLTGQETRDPMRIIVDSKLAISEQANVLNLESDAPTVIATTKRAPADRLKQLQKRANVIVVNDGPQVDLAVLLDILGKMEVTSILVEGGSRINGSFLTANLVDRYYFYLAPIIIGGQHAPGPFSKGFSSLADALALTDISVEQLGPDILVTGCPKFPNFK